MNYKLSPATSRQLVLIPCIYDGNCDMAWKNREGTAAMSQQCFWVQHLKIDQAIQIVDLTKEGTYEIFADNSVCFAGVSNTQARCLKFARP